MRLQFVDLAVFVERLSPGLKWDRFDGSECAAAAQFGSIARQPYALFARGDAEVHGAVGETRHRLRGSSTALAVRHERKEREQHQREKRNAMLHRSLRWRHASMKRRTSTELSARQAMDQPERQRHNVPDHVK